LLDLFKEIKKENKEKILGIDENGRRNERRLYQRCNRQRTKLV
jgi:hypothetical protein